MILRNYYKNSFGFELETTVQPNKFNKNNINIIIYLYKTDDMEFVDFEKHIFLKIKTIKQLNKTLLFFNSSLLKNIIYCFDFQNRTLKDLDNIIKSCLNYKY